MPAPRTLEDWKPLPAERRLAEGMASGLIVQIGDGTLPPEDSPEDRVIRTSFLRALILRQVEGHPPHEKGVRVAGAYLRGDGPEGAETRGLDLEGCDLNRDLVLFACRIPDRLLLRSASLHNLYLNGSHLGAGLHADQLEAKGGVFLRGLGDPKSPIYRSFVAQGEVWLVGARLGGSLECDGAQLMAGEGSYALALDGMRLQGGFFLRNGAQIDGVLDLTGAEIGHFNDDPACWPQRRGDLLLDRCRYGAFLGRSPVGAQSRIRWLSLQDESLWEAEFWPQPWEECARVLREMGHGAAARDILIEKEKRQRAARRARLRREHLYEDAYWHAVWDRVLGATVRYGRMPLLAAAWLVVLWIIGALVFGNALARDQVKPNLPQIQRAPEWVLCGAAEGELVAMAGQAPAPGLRRPGQSRIACFHSQPEGAGHPRFDALIYSADTLIPVVSLEMQSYWIPDDSRPFGAFARFYLWLHIAAGWGLTLLAVAGFSGLIKTDNTR